MSLRVNCPSCGHSGSVPRQAMGRRVTCPKCGRDFVLPVKADLIAPSVPEPAEVKPRQAEPRAPPSPLVPADKDGHSVPPEAMQGTGRAVTSTDTNATGVLPEKRVCLCCGKRLLPKEHVCPDCAKHAGVRDAAKREMSSAEIASRKSRRTLGNVLFTLSLLAMLPAAGFVYETCKAHPNMSWIDHPWLMLTTFAVLLLPSTILAEIARRMR